MAYSGGDGFTAWGVIINTPKNARNTDGIDPGSSTNVTVTHCFIHAGDDNVAIKAGGHCSHMTIAHNHFYTGHGMSIGSETNGGASAIMVTDLSVDGADNGIRIKSNSGKGGKVNDVAYEDVCIRDTKNPIYMDSDYAHFGRTGDKLPWFTGVVLKDVRVQGAGKITLQGFDAEHRLGMTFDNVQFDSLKDIKVLAEHAGSEIRPRGRKPEEGRRRGCRPHRLALQRHAKRLYGQVRPDARPVTGGVDMAVDAARRSACATATLASREARQTTKVRWSVPTGPVTIKSCLLRSVLTSSSPVNRSRATSATCAPW